MAHTCPECGQTCHCGGDIDDLILDFDEDVIGCTHCSDEDMEEYWDDMEEDGCEFVDGGCGCCPYDEPICKKFFDEQENCY